MLRAPTKAFAPFAAAIALMLVAMPATSADHSSPVRGTTRSHAARHRAAATKKTTGAKPAPTAPGAAGFRVAIDPVTGALVPATSPAQVGDLSALSAVEIERLRQNVRVEHRADGSMHANVDGLVQDYAIATIGEDGSLQFGCVQGKDQAEAALKARPRVRSTKREAK